VRKNLDFLYAEAIFKYKNKEELCLRGEAATIAEELQNERYNQDDWQDHIKKFLNEKDKTTILKIWEEGFMKDTTQLGYREQARIGKILRRLGWVRKTVVIDGETTSGFTKKY
jgi:predicted P-loop ATPase